MTDLHWSGSVKEVEKDLGGSWRVLDSSRVYGGSTSVKKVSGRVFNIFGGLLWSERVWKDPRGPTRIWEGPGGSWCAWMIWEGLGGSRRYKTGLTDLHWSRRVQEGLCGSGRAQEGLEGSGRVWRVREGQGGS